MSTYLREVSLSVITACGLVLLAPMPAVYAVNYTTTGGNWDTTTIWTPNGDPGSGDSVFLNGAVSVSAGNEFGTASLDSFWTSGDTWTLMVWSGTRTGTATLGSIPAGLSFILNNNANDLQLVFGSGPVVGTIVIVR